MLTLPVLLHFHFKAAVLQMLKKWKKSNGKYWSSHVLVEQSIITDPLIQLTNRW